MQLIHEQLENESYGNHYNALRYINVLGRHFELESQKRMKQILCFVFLYAQNLLSRDLGVHLITPNSPYLWVAISGGGDRPKICQEEFEITKKHVSKCVRKL